MVMKATHVKFTDETMGVIQRLAIEFGTTQVGVLRFGVKLLELAAREERGGNKIGIIHDGRIVKELVSVWNQRQ